MKQFSAVLGLACLGLILPGAGVVLGQYNGEIVAWGLNDWGQCTPPGGTFVTVAGGQYHSLGLKSDSSVAAWGINDYGQCNVPAPNTDFVAVSTARHHSLGLKSDSTIVAWGSNSWGQCSVPSPNADFVAVAAGGYHSLGLKSDGTIIAWGFNEEGECDIPSPNADFVAIDAGIFHGLGLKSDGTIVAWGLNDDGQSNEPSPNADFVTIAAGGFRNLGLKSDGTVVAWGQSHIVPSPNADFVAIAGGGVHCMALKSDGTIVAWGSNSGGQCDVPPPNADFVAIAGGFYHSLGIKGCVLEVTYPNGGETLIEGEAVDLIWDPYSLCGEWVRIELVREGSVCALITDSTENDGTHAWVAGRCGLSIEGYRIRVTDLETGTTDESDSSFRVVPAFRILSIADVDDDQGRRVRLRWHREDNDQAGGDTTITSYGIWRRIDQQKETPRSRIGADGHRYPPGDWDYVTSIPAHGEETYSTLCETVCDSTIVSGICWSVFFVRAETPVPLVYFDTLPDSGYSVDNLDPSAPVSLLAELAGEDVLLTWDPSDEDDFDYYAVYRGTEEGFDPGTPIGYSTTATYTDGDTPGPGEYWYKITAKDFSGNESDASDPAGVQLTGVAEAEAVLPAMFYLGPAVPNPFNPVTEITYGIPAGATVSRVVMHVYNATGRRVTTLVDSEQGPGTYHVVWDGRDHKGAGVASGVYFYHLVTPEFGETRRMVLVK